MGLTLPDWSSVPDDRLLERLPSLATMSGQAEEGLRGAVEELRRREVTWERIGASLGTTRQSAWERFSGTG